MTNWVVVTVQDANMGLTVMLASRVSLLSWPLFHASLCRTKQKENTMSVDYHKQPSHNV